MFIHAHDGHVWVRMGAVGCVGIVQHGNVDWRGPGGRCGQGLVHAVHAKYTRKQSCTRGASMGAVITGGKTGHE